MSERIVPGEELRKISSLIQAGIDNTDAETIAQLRRQLIDAARTGIISPTEAIDASFPPYFGTAERQQDNS